MACRPSPATWIESNPDHKRPCNSCSDACDPDLSIHAARSAGHPFMSRCSVRLPIVQNLDLLPSCENLLISLPLVRAWGAAEES